MPHPRAKSLRKAYSPAFQFPTSEISQFGSLISQTERILLLQKTLLAAAKERRKNQRDAAGTDAGTRWAAAIRQSAISLTGLPVKDVFKLRSGEQESWSALNRMEGILSNGPVRPYLPNENVQELDCMQDEHRSKLLNQIHSDWDALHQAFRAVLIDCKNLSGAHPRSRRDLLYSTYITCDLCWRYAPAGGKKLARCAFHASTSPRPKPAIGPTYSAADRISRTSIIVDLGNNEYSALMQPVLMKDIRSRLPKKYLANNPSHASNDNSLILMMIERGDLSALSKIQRHTINWGVIWKYFPKTKEMIRAENSTSCQLVLSRLDPIDRDLQGIHQAIHTAILKNELLIIPMLIQAEAWESCRLIRCRKERLPINMRYEQ